MKSSNGSVPRRSNLSTQVPAAAVEWDAALLGRMYELRGLLLMSCVLAALVNFATINFMKVATPTVVSLAGMLPVVLSTAASTVVFHSTLSRLQEVLGCK